MLPPEPERYKCSGDEAPTVREAGCRRTSRIKPVHKTVALPEDFENSRVFILSPKRRQH
jgi:hypothetical protein